MRSVVLATICVNARAQHAEGALMRARRSRALAHSVPILVEEAGRGRKRIGEDLLFQSGPGKAINRLQPGFDGCDLGDEPVERWTSALYRY